MTVMWAEIADFPNYSVNKLGEVINHENGKLVRQSITHQGAVKVNLTKNGKQYTRSVKLLVATTFVKGMSDVFDTPIHLDNDQLNNNAKNLAWRPRWFAWKYTHQFQDIPDTHFKGPILEITTGRIHKNVVEASVANGVLFKDVWKSIQQKEPAVPNGLEFDLVRHR